MANESTFIFGPIQEAWLKSLEEHPERQYTHGALGWGNPDSYKACCLCELAIIAGVAVFNTDGEITVQFSARTISGKWEELGLYSPIGAPKGYEENMDSAISLSMMNDGYYVKDTEVPSKTWPEIAAIIRANPELYLSKSV